MKKVLGRGNGVEKGSEEERRGLLDGQQRGEQEANGNGGEGSR